MPTRSDLALELHLGKILSGATAEDRPRFRRAPRPPLDRTWIGLRLRPLFGLGNPEPGDGVC